MLYKTLRSGRNANKNATVLALTACISLLLVGCEQRDTATPPALDSATLETEQAQTQQAGELLEEGFYGDNLNDSDKQTNDTIGSTNSLEASAQKESINNVSEQDTEVKNIVEELGFSAAEDDDSLNSTDAPAEIFCITNQAIELAASEPQACQRISNRLASVSFENCSSANLVPSGCASVDGFPILVREFAPVEQIKPQARILLIGGTHGDELTSVSVTFRWIEKLNSHHSGLFHWRIAPMMNPDGVLNRHASRTNQNGVDLNRNLPSDDWEALAHNYWETKSGKNARKFPGDKAGSEPETQWLIDEINSFKPDAIISVHAPYGVVDFDALLLNAAPKSLGKLHLNLLGTYPGSLGNYAGINRNIPVITLELPHSWEMPSEKETTKIWEDIVAWLKKNVGNDVVKN